MKKILYLATSLNGFIAKTDDSTSWSDAEWIEYKTRVNNSAIIIGRKTYEIMKSDNVFDEMNCKVAVVSHSKINNIFTSTNPQDIIENFEKQNFKEVFITGGRMVNTLFLKHKLIDEILLDIEPILYGDGISLVQETDSDINLTFLRSKMLSANTIQLHYKVNND